MTIVQYKPKLTRHDMQASLRQAAVGIDRRINSVILASWLRQLVLFPEIHVPGKNDLQRPKNNGTMIERHTSPSQVEGVGR
jgi:hypothetical protein